MPFALIDRWLAPAPVPERVDWLKQAEYAHRGLHGAGMVENSPTAFALAIERGLGIECDVQCSADFQPVVFHDWTLGRLTEKQGRVCEIPSGTLTSIRLKDSEDRILRLSDLLALLRGRVPLLIEIKSGQSTPVHEFCRSILLDIEARPGRHAIMSFDHRIVRWFAVNAPHVVRGLVMSEDGKRGLPGHWERHWSLWRSRPDFLAYDVRDLPSRFAASQRSRGVPLLAWTVRSPGLRKRAAIYADAPIAEGDGLECL